MLDYIPAVSYTHLDVYKRQPGTPAILNAIYDAVGVRVYDLPAKPEKILNLLDQNPGQ